MVRVNRVSRYLSRSTKQAVAEVGLADFDYQTLHVLMIRDTPGRATPSALARDLDVSAAGMTGRLDGLEGAGYVNRIPSSADRRRVDVEATRTGVAIWRRAMALRGVAEEDLASTLTRKELATLNRLLKRLTLHIEDGGPAG